VFKETFILEREELEELKRIMTSPLKGGGRVNLLS